MKVADKPLNQVAQGVADEIKQAAATLQTTPASVARQLELNQAEMLERIAYKSAPTSQRLSAELDQLAAWARANKTTVAKVFVTVIAALEGKLQAAGPISFRERMNGEGPTIGVQPRPAENGAGVTQRVWQLAYKGGSIGVNVGPIQEAPTQAVMCPTTPSLEIGNGAVENAIADAAGKNFGKALTAARGKDQKIGYGQARMMESSGSLAEHGIKKIVLSAVTPSGADRPGGMTSKDMADFTYNACNAANQSGVQSLTIPAVGTGFAAAFGFGMSLGDSLKGFAEGVKRFLDEQGAKATLQQIDYNLYKGDRPAAEDAKSVAGLLEKTGVAHILA